MVVDQWVDMYLQPLLQLVDEESEREGDLSVGKTFRCCMNLSLFGDFHFVLIRDFCVALV
ncbi:hypothetical protein QQP08_021771 [Theobroma cacao]|nr:hypothetical protein QQP08_021771 [Theobroma cacao]